MSNAQNEKRKIAETVHQPVEDATGALRPDRPFTADEAQAIDAANRARYVEARQQRFARRRSRR